MPQVTFRPLDQCTPDDPTDGAPAPSIEPSNGAPPNTPPPSTAPSCEPRVPGADGQGGDACTDALVRRFSGEGGAPSIEAAPDAAGSSRSCVGEALRALSSCSPLLFPAELPISYLASQQFGCAASALSLVECLTKDDGVR